MQQPGHKWADPGFRCEEADLRVQPEGPPGFIQQMQDSRAARWNYTPAKFVHTIVPYFLAGPWIWCPVMHVGAAGMRIAVLEYSNHNKGHSARGVSCVLFVVEAHP